MHRNNRKRDMSERWVQRHTYKEREREIIKEKVKECERVKMWGGYVSGCECMCVKRERVGERERMSPREW